MPAQGATAWRHSALCAASSALFGFRSNQVKIMIASKESFEPHSSEQLPASKKIFVAGTIHPDVRVPMREIEVGDTKSYTGAVETNAPVRVYDCSGPWGDPDFDGTSDEGLPALRAEWILKRGDVAEYSGREVKPMDNGYLSGKHAEFASKAEKNRLVEFPGLLGQRRKPLRASRGHPVTQLWYAKQDIITSGDGVHRHPRKHGSCKDG
jgi:phosphomethylpyrimidine synthase